METFNKTNEVKNHLEVLKDNPIADESYYTKLESLCRAIFSISDRAIGLLSYLESDIKKNRNIIEQRINDIRETQFQIEAIADIIEERISNKAFMEFVDLIYEYNSLSKNKKAIE